MINGVANKQWMSCFVKGQKKLLDRSIIIAWILYQFVPEIIKEGPKIWGGEGGFQVLGMTLKYF